MVLVSSRTRRGYPGLCIWERLECLVCWALCTASLPPLIKRNIGQTAYFGWKEYSEAKKGDVVFVTAGAGEYVEAGHLGSDQTRIGPVGSMVIQIAKADGVKIIASAGSDEKCDYMKSLGADVVFNYKTTKTADVLEKEGPVDV